MEDERQYPHVLQLVEARMGVNTRTRLYAAVCKYSADKFSIERELRKHYEPYDCSNMSIKFKLDYFELIDNEILEAGGTRLYLTKVSIYDKCLNGSYKDVVRYQMVRAETSLQAKQASSRSVWKKKGSRECKIVSVISLEGVYDIIHVGELVQGL